MAEPFLGEIRIFPFGLTPRGWLPCNGALLQIMQNQALYSLLGITFGGDGKTTFCVPDLRGRVPVPPGTNPRSGNTVQNGQKDGTETVTLTANQIPPHVHQVFANGSNSDIGTPVTPTTGYLWAVADDPTGATVSAYAAGANTTLAPTALSAAGGSQGHNNLQPYLVVNFCIATMGIYPPRP